MTVNDTVKQQFEKIDTDNDGYITADELKRDLRAGSSKVSDENVQRIVAMADKDGNQRIDLKEYAEFVK